MLPSLNISRTLILSIILLFLLPKSTDALSIGMAPPVYDLGLVEPGKEYYMDFYVITDQDQDILIDLEKDRAPYDFYLPERIRFRYTFNSSQSSEEDPSAWITFLDNNPITIPPEKQTYRLSNGGLANANKRLSAVVKIPEDAEPGYHAAYVVPFSREKAQGGGAVIGIISTAKMGYVFNVKGDAVREGKIVGFTYERTTSSGTLNMIFKNTGTVTMTVAGRDITIFDKNQQPLTVLSTKTISVKPGEIIEMPAAFFNSSIEEGMYNVEGKAVWIEGETTGSGRVQITKEPTVKEVTGQVTIPPPSAVFPLWIIPIVLALFGFMVFRWKK